MGYILVVRFIELQNINRLLSDKRLQYVFLFGFLPTFTLWLILGFVWFVEAITSDCVGAMNNKCLECKRQFRLLPCDVSVSTPIPVVLRFSFPRNKKQSIRSYY